MKEMVVITALICGSWDSGEDHDQPFKPAPYVDIPTTSSPPVGVQRSEARISPSLLEELENQSTDLGKQSTRFNRLFPSNSLGRFCAPHTSMPPSDASSNPLYNLHSLFSLRPMLLVVICNILFLVALTSTFYDMSANLAFEEMNVEQCFFTRSDLFLLGPSYLRVKSLKLVDSRNLVVRDPKV